MCKSRLIFHSEHPGFGDLLNNSIGLTPDKKLPQKMDLGQYNITEKRTFSHGETDFDGIYRI
jgi:hypothetical protein